MTCDVKIAYVDTKLSGYIKQLFSKSSLRIRLCLRSDTFMFENRLYKTHVTFTPRRIDR